MKHLFLVHSNITDIVAQQIVKQYELPVEDVIFLLARNQHSNFKNKIKFPYSHFPIDSFKVSFFFWKNWRKLKNIDNWINELTAKQAFHFYTPQSGMNVFYLITSHPLCKGFSYIEEGLASYKRFKQIKNPKANSKLRDLLYYINFKGRSKSVKHFFDLDHPKLLDSYGLSELSFPDLKKKQIIEKPFKNNKLNTKAEAENILILGPYIEFGEIKKEILLEALGELFDWMFQIKIDALNIKFHPAQDESISINPILDLFSSYKNKINFNILEDHFILEKYAFENKVDFYIVISSLAIYANVSGNKVYSIAERIASKQSNYQKHIDSMPFFLHDIIEFI